MNAVMKYEFKGTPGIWLLSDETVSPYEKGFYHDTYNGIRAGAGCFTSQDRNEGFDITGCISIENAQLIASAPLLLSALIKAVEDEAFYMEGGGIEAPWFKEAKSAIEAALNLKTVEK
jgi:hypothetical protein